MKPMVLASRLLRAPRVTAIRYDMGNHHRPCVEVPEFWLRVLHIVVLQIHLNAQQRVIAMFQEV